MTRTLFAAGILFLFLIGCAAKEPQTQQEMTEGASMTDKVEATTPTEAEKVEAGAMAEPEKVIEEKKDPCEVKIDEAVQQARNTMKTVKESCEGLHIEVNPMWDMDYAGTVHIRVYDAAGNDVRDELRKPEEGGM
jgi:hypothetical protein